MVEKWANEKESVQGNKGSLEHSAGQILLWLEIKFIEQYYASLINTIVEIPSPCQF